MLEIIYFTYKPQNQSKTAPDIFRKSQKISGQSKTSIEGKLRLIDTCRNDTNDEATKPLTTNYDNFNFLHGIPNQWFISKVVKRNSRDEIQDETPEGQ